MVRATSINPIDLMRRSGTAKDFAPVTFPAILGVDLSGTVVDIGPGVKDFIAGVRKNQMEEARALGAKEVVALDDDQAIADLPELDAVADAVDGETAQKLIGKVRAGGVFASVLGPPQNAKDFGAVKVVPVFAQADATVLRHMVQAVKTGRLTIPIGQKLP